MAARRLVRQQLTTALLWLAIGLWKIVALVLVVTALSSRWREVLWAAGMTLVLVVLALRFRAGRSDRIDAVGAWPVLAGLAAIAAGLQLHALLA